jgi:iron-sulfur cluster assembly protein
MVVKLLPLAKTKMIDILRRHHTKSLLFSVKGGGCNGFNYHFEPTNEKPHKNDEVIHIDKEHSLIVCGKSLLHIFGVEIDYKEGIMGTGFEFSNPNATGKCGCGKSFN